MDGVFGNSTYNGVYCYQNNTRGLTGSGPDGLVGPRTWRNLGYHTLYSMLFDPGVLYYKLFDGLDYIQFAKYTSCPNDARACSWFVLSPSGGQFNYMDIYGPQVGP